MTWSALVTGGSGYFGTTLVEHLARAGHRVRNFDLNVPHTAPGGVEFVQGDIRDAPVVREAVRDIDVVFHNVAQVPLAKQRALIDSVNIDGTAVLLRAAKDAGVAKVVHTSTSAVYGVPRRNPITERDPLTPAELYGRAKAQAEGLCEAAAAGGLDVTIVRPRTLVGHGRLGIFAILFEWIADGAPVFVLGRGDNRYQLLHADDMARACLLAAARPGPTSYNVGAGEFGTMRQTLQSLVEHAGTGATVRSLPARPAIAAMSALSKARLAPFGPYHWLMYGRSMWFDIAKAADELGWQPEHSNEAMVRQSYDWYVEHRHALAGGGSAHQRRPAQRMLRVLKWASATALR